jgi:hypothetical protein
LKLAEKDSAKRIVDEVEKIMNTDNEKQMWW